MEVATIQHIEPDQLHDCEADLFITAIGYESRCTSIARLLEGNNCRKTALWTQHHNKELAFESNKNYFSSQNFDLIKVTSAVPDMDVLLNGETGDTLKIIVDCTSMSPQWYFEFFRWFSDLSDRFEHAILRFTYTMANFVEQETNHKVKRIEDFLKEKNWAVNSKKKKVLILGLGHEENVGESIYKLINPDLVYLFYADPPVERRFVEKIFVNNHGLINDTPIRNLIAYPIRNGQMIYQSMIDIILPLRNEYEIIVVPQGPKIFAVASMLVQLSYPDISIHYPVFKKEQLLDRESSGDPVIMDIHFEGEE